jgi:hypothetical protein
MRVRALLLVKVVQLFIMVLNEWSEGEQSINQQVYSFQALLTVGSPQIVVAKLWQNYRVQSGLVGSSAASDSSVSD